MEVKRYKKIGLYRWIEQAEQDRREEEIPVLLIREDHAKDWWVCFPIKDTKELVSRWQQQFDSAPTPKMQGS